MAQARSAAEGRVIDTSKIHNGGLSPEYKARSGSNSAPSALSFAANTVQGPDSIVELAQALKNDPQLIFEFVYNNIDWQPGWGVMKGALGALLDGSGNAFDQSMLLAALLRQAGYTANYVLGQIQLTTDQYDAWFGTDSTSNAYCCYWYAQYANIPGNAPSWTGTNWIMQMGHVWVQVVIGGTTYVLDPSRKTYSRKSPLANLDTILGYNAATFLADASTGATIDGSGNFVQNMNTTNIAADLSTFTANLQTYIRNNTVGSAPAGTAGVDDILGGASIVPLTLPFTWQTALSYEAPGDTPTVWTGDIPVAYKTTLQVQYPLSPSGWAIDQTFTSDQLAGGRLTLTFDGSLHPVLTLNGTVVATGSQAQAAGSWNSVQLTVNHNAYPWPVYPQQWWQSYIYAGQYYLIGNAWGSLGRGQSDFHQTKLAAALANPSVSNEELNGEYMSALWFNWAAQTSQVADLVSRLRSTYMNFFHQVGIISLSYSGGIPTPATDIGGVSGFSSTLNFDFSQLSPTNTLIAMHGVALEAAAVAQFNGTAPGISTSTVIDRANRTAVFTLGGTVTAGDILTITVNDSALSGGSLSKTHTVTAGESLASLASALASAINSDTALATIGVSASANGAVLQASSTSADQTSYSASVNGGASETISVAWSKIFLANSSNWTSGINISNILTNNGVDAGTISNIGFYINTDGFPVMVPDQSYYVLGSQNADGYWALPPYGSNGGAFGLINTVSKGAVGQPKKGKKTPPPPPPPPPSIGDPINPFSGAFTTVTHDLSLGSGPEPYMLNFERSYSSGDQYESRPVGLGWNHNHNISADVGSDGLLAMGYFAALPGAATLAQLYVVSNLASDSGQPITKLVTMSLAGKWWLDQLINNTVSINSGDSTLVFTKQPDGSYIAPLSAAATLSYSGGAYTMTTAQKVQYQFNTSGQIAAIVYPYGVTVSYSYSGGLLTAVTNGMGRTLSFSYTGPLLTGVSDGTGRNIGFSYDGSNNLTAFTDAMANQITYQYDQPGRLTKVFYPANPATAVVSNTYDSLSRVKTQANGLGQVWTYYFAQARAEQDDPLGNKTVWYFNRFAAVTRSIDALGNETDYVMDGLGRTIKVTMPEGNQILFTYDANNNILTRTKVPKAGSGLSNVTETYTYDTAWARVKTYTDGNLNTWTYTYDASLGNLLQIQKPAVAGGTPTVSMTYNGRGQMVTSTDETGIVTKYNYDAVKETMTSRIVDYAGGGGHLNLTTQFSYDSVGNVNGITDPAGNSTTFQLDANRRLTQRTEAAPFGYLTTASYDANGNRLTLKRQTGANPAWQVRSYTYSATNKLLSETDPAGKTGNLVYDGKDRLQSLTDAEGRSWQRIYDACDRVSQFTAPSGTTSETRTYTNNGLIASIKDANNNITQYTYDGLDRLDKTVYADSTYERNSSYDANGNVLTHLTRSGSSVTRTYDALNRTLTRAPSGQATVTSTYDLSGRLTQINKAGTPGSDPSIGSLQYFFDSAGRFYKEQYPDGKTVTHILDLNGNRTRTTWPDGYYVSRIFDQLNRLTGIQLNGSGVNAVSIGYNQLSQRTLLSYNNGASISYTPMPNGDLANITHNFVGSNVSFNYGFNDVNEAVSFASSDKGYVWNPGASGTVGYGTADSVNKYPSVAGHNFSYDGNKNLTGDGTWTYTYDTENHLLSAVGAVSATMVYDPQHRQVQKTAAATTRYVYADWQRIADYDGLTNTLQTRYIYGSELDDALLSVSAAGVVTYLHPDRLGSIIATSDAAGAVTNKNLYSPYGEATVAGTTIGFTGQRFDSDLGLYYYKNRYYSPTLGRFLQTDPLGYTTLNLMDCGCGCGGMDECAPRELNLYSYVQNSPLRYTDPFGLEPQQTPTEGGFVWCNILCSSIADPGVSYIICMEVCLAS